MKSITETDSEFICHIDAPCFQMLSHEEIELVRSSKTQILFRKGDNLTKQGAFVSYVLFLITGLAKQFIEGDGNSSYNLKIIAPGEFLGLSAVFSKNTFNYSTIALTDCQAFLVEKTAIERVAKENGSFGFSIIKRYTEHYSYLFDTVRNFMNKQTNGRLADAILYIDGLKQRHPDIFQLLLRKDIADFAGISTETAVKLLKSFEKDSIISLKDKDIIVLDKERLINISKTG
ncbi:MAG: Crp/Fnr family transcriptional regulator [Bacteroidales bacterium]|jgi:CRP/FNR family transcriptional regulator|nr:Crp/Fnr family transcriptional regulator [Bacteroidales bacterium]